MFRRVFCAVVVAASGTALGAQQQTAATSGPQFDVVSIKLNTGGVSNSTLTERPDGGLRSINRPLYTLIARAYPPTLPVEIVGVPEWARTDRYDVIATASLAHATPDDRAAMLRAMLADRFKLVAHYEKREQEGFELVLARQDGRLGSGLVKTDTDCSELPDPSATRPDFNAPPPPCTMRSVGAMLRKDGRALGDLLEGDAPIATFIDAIRIATRGRAVIDKTGLTGSYRITLNFDLMGTLRPPSVDAPASTGAATLLTAIQEQLGLKLQPTRVVRDTLVIDHLERPTPN